jgi:hypothetical protein
MKHFKFIVLALFLVPPAVPSAQSTQNYQLGIAGGGGYNILNNGIGYSFTIFGKQQNRLFKYRYIHGRDFAANGLSEIPDLLGKSYPLRSLDASALLLGYEPIEGLQLFIGVAYSRGITHGELIHLDEARHPTKYHNSVAFRSAGLAYEINCPIFKSENHGFGVEAFTEGEWNPFFFFNHSGIRLTFLMIK